MLVRKAKLEDIEGITDFNIRMAKETESKKLDKDVVLKGVEAVINDNHKGFYLVAEETNGGKKLVGQLMITFEWSDWRNKCFWWIQSVYVDEKHRNRNIFSHLYRRVIEMAKSRKNISGLRLYVEKHNEYAKQIYESLGMIRTPYEMYEIPI